MSPPLLNRRDKVSWPAASVLTHSTPLASVVSWADERRFRHTSSMGGSSVTLQTAEAVRPTRPAGPELVTMCTEAPRRAMAAR